MSKQVWLLFAVHWKNHCVQINSQCRCRRFIVVQKIKEGKGDFGFNARTEVYENLFKAGVIDPTKVSRVALENAASIAGMLLTTECVIADKPKEEAPHSHGAPDMGGMGYYEEKKYYINCPSLHKKT